MLTARYLRYIGLGCGGVLVVALAVAVAKLLPFTFKSGVALGSIGPLAAAAFATVLESSWLLGTAPGFAFAAQKRLSHGPKDAAIGSAETVSRLRSALWPAVGWTIATAILGGIVNLELATPGRVANGLLATAKDACSTGPATKQVTIPILGSRWQCSPKREPTLVGEFYHASSGLTYTARDMSVSDDMTYVELSQLKLTSRGTKTRPALRLAVEGARLRGLWPLARPARLGAFGRAMLVSFTGSSLGLLAIWALASRRWSPWLAAAFGLAFSLSAWLMLLHLDSGPKHAPLHYALVPIAGYTLALTSGIVFRSSRIARTVSRLFHRTARVET